MTIIAGLVLAAAIAGPHAARATEVTPNGPVTYLALIWIKPGGETKLAEYETRFREILAQHQAGAQPVAILRPTALQSSQRGGFAYPRIPDRIDVVTFPARTTWPTIQQSQEWQRIKPIRDAALEDFVLFETQNLFDRAHQ